MAKLNNDVADRIRLNAGSQRSGETIISFLEFALDNEPNFEVRLGHENWKAIDMWRSTYRIGIIFPKRGVIKFFNRIQTRGTADYAPGRLNNRGEWTFDATNLLSNDPMLRCMHDNIRSLS